MSLATHMRVSALLLACHTRGEGVYVVRKGDRTAGALLVRQSHRDGTGTLHARRYTMENEAEWQPVSGDAPLPDVELDGIVARRADADPDLWVVEVETDDMGRLLETL